MSRSAALVLNQKHIQRTQPEHHKRVAVNPVFDPVQFAGCQIFFFGHGPNIANTTFVKITNSAVVLHVLVVPLVVGCKSQYSEKHSNHPVYLLRFKIRSVSAIVEDNEQPNQKTCSQYN
jgi:ACR3 family arsenite efflux pump ArsB